MPREFPPNIETIVSEAEDLRKIAKNSFDVYISLRTYSSSLFDMRAAIHEANRVLRSGGIIVISIPTLYIGKTGKPISGLINHAQSAIAKQNAIYKVNRIQQYMEVLEFERIKRHSSSPYEIYITAQKR